MKTCIHAWSELHAWFSKEPGYEIDILVLTTHHLIASFLTNLNAVFSSMLTASTTSPSSHRAPVP